MKIVFLLLLTLASAMGGARLEWDSNAASDGVGYYRVYRSTNSIDGPFFPYSQVATNSVLLGPLISGRHFFFVTAISTNGFESDPSNKVLAPVPNPPQNTRIIITIP